MLRCPHLASDAYARSGEQLCPWPLFESAPIVQSVSSKGQHITDAELDRQILSWANQRLGSAGKRRRISSFHDSSLSTGLPLVIYDSLSLQ